jgi:hypothetical protein
VTGRRGVPDPDALGALTSGGLRRAPDVDPVLGAAGVGSPQQRAAPAVSTPPAAAVPVASPPPAGPAPAATGKAKAQFHIAAADLGRARAAYLHSHVAEGERSWSEFVAAAVLREVARRETLYNGGRPWPPAGAGELPTGRPFRG